MKLFLVRRKKPYDGGVLGVVRAEDEDKARVVLYSYECCNDYETLDEWFFRVGENYEFMELPVGGKERVVYYSE